MPPTDSNSITFNFPHGPRRPVIFCLNAAICVCSLCAVHSIECEFANLFDTRTFRSHLFPFIAVRRRCSRCFYLRRVQFEVYLWRAHFAACFGYFFFRWEPCGCINFSFLCHTKFRLCVPPRWVPLVLRGMMRLALFPSRFFLFVFHSPSVGSGSGAVTSQKHILKMPFFVSPNFWYGWRDIYCRRCQYQQPRRRPAHSNPHEKRPQPEQRRRESGNTKN